MSSMLVNSPSLNPAAFFHFYYTKNFKNYKQKGKIYLLCECQPKSEPLAHEFLSHLSIRHLPFAAVQTVRLSIHI